MFNVQFGLVMETKINIAAILKDKPQGTKLYSSACGKCNLVSVDDKSFKISFYNSKFGFMNGGDGYLDKFGKLYDDGECVIFPSKEMRDWRKFSWRKGDVLVSTDGKCKVIFERFDDDTYTSFVGKYYVECYGKNDELLDYEEEHYGDTVNYTKESKEVAQSYISTIEERLGGNLNRETLEVEKPLPEFKDGDIVVYGKSVAICRKFYKDTLYFYVSINEMFGFLFDDEVESSEEYRFATEEEKKQLFSALEKEGKRWDSDKKAIVDLKPKVELKPFDKVLVRDFGSQAWQVSLFSYKDSDSYYCCNGCGWNQCIPYNEKTAHLLGTTGEWKGGEG